MAKYEPDNYLESHTTQLQQAKQFCLESLNAEKKPGLVLHNFIFAQHLYDHIERTRLNLNLAPHRAISAKIAAWMYVLGFQDNYTEPEIGALEQAKRFSAHVQLSQELADKVNYCLYCTSAPYTDPVAEEARLFLDALNSFCWIEDFDNYVKLLKVEQKMISGEIISNLQFDEKLLQNLLSIRFFHPHSNVIYQALLNQKISDYTEKVEKGRVKEETLQNSGQFAQIEKKIPNSGIQTFYRTNYRNHINLSAIADNKANIMISVNAILISVILSIVSYKNLAEENPMILMPVIIFLVTGLSSLVFAVLSARPKVTRQAEDASPDEIKKNIVFFGSFTRLKPETFEKALDEVFRDSSLLYGNMSRDLYNLGKVLDKKYKYLTVSYNLFMLGFIFTVLTFIIALLLGGSTS